MIVEAVAAASAVRAVATIAAAATSTGGHCNFFI